MARTSDRRIEHLLRRAGFGARPDEIDYYGEMSVGAGRRRAPQLRAYRRRRRRLHRQAGYVGTTTPRPVPAAVEHHRRAPAVAVPDGAQRPAAPGEDDALLAQPFRDRRTRRSPARWARRKATRYMAAKASEDPARVRGQIEMLRDNALGNFRDILVNIAKDTAMLVWLDGRTNTQGEAAGELRAARSWSCSRWASGTTPRPTSMPARACSPAGTWRARAPRPTARSTTSSSTTPGSTTPAAKTFSFPIYADGSKTIPGARRRRRHAGRPRSHQRAGGAARTPARYLATKAVSLLRVGGRRRSTTPFVERIAVGLPAEPLRHEGGDARGAAVAGVLGPERLLRALLVAGRVRRPRAEGHRLGRLLGRTTR